MLGKVLRNNDVGPLLTLRRRPDSEFQHLTFIYQNIYFGIMNTHTILNIKTDKKLKAEAKMVSEELGVPLSTVINAFLKQFVRDKEITLSANQYRPTPYLESILEQAQKEYEAGDFVGPFKKGEDFIAHLKSL